MGEARRGRGQLGLGAAAPATAAPMAATPATATRRAGAQTSAGAGQSGATPTYAGAARRAAHPRGGACAKSAATRSQATSGAPPSATLAGGRVSDSGCGKYWAPPSPAPWGPSPQGPSPAVASITAALRQAEEELIKADHERCMRELERGQAQEALLTMREQLELAQNQQRSTVHLAGTFSANQAAMYNGQLQPPQQQP